MPTKLTKTLLFLSGYLPLFVIISIQNRGVWGWWAIAPTVAALIGTAWLWFFLLWVRRGSAVTFEVASVQRRDSEVMAYLFTYVIPFLAINGKDSSQAAGLGIFFFVLLVLHVQGSMIHVNPMLSLAGYHVYEIAGSDGNTFSILTRRKRILAPASLSAVVVGDDLLVEKQ